MSSPSDQTPQESPSADPSADAAAPVHAMTQSSAVDVHARSVLHERPDALVRLQRRGTQPLRFNGHLLLSGYTPSLEQADLHFGVDLFETDEGSFVASAWQRSFGEEAMPIVVSEGDDFGDLVDKLISVSPIQPRLLAQVQNLDQDWEQSEQSVADMSSKIDQIQADYVRTVKQVFDPSVQFHPHTEE